MFWSFIRVRTSTSQSVLSLVQCFCCLWTEAAVRLISSRTFSFMNPTSNTAKIYITEKKNNDNKCTEIIKLLADVLVCLWNETETVSQTVKNSFYFVFLKQLIDNQVGDQSVDRYCSPQIKQWISRWRISWQTVKLTNTEITLISCQTITSIRLLWSRINQTDQLSLHTK